MVGPGGWKMRFTEFLAPGSIRPSLRASDRKGVLEELADLLAPSAGVPAGVLGSLLLERERVASTAMTGGVAIPHCRLEGLPRLIACVGIHREGCAFGAPEDGRVHVFVGLASPLRTAGLHLGVLARIAGMLRNTSLRQALRQAPTAAHIHELLLQAEEAYVAGMVHSEGPALSAGP
jgi:nitrogen PTS system EIIA component